MPQIGAAKLRDLSADDLDAWLDGRAAELATRTLRELLSILRRSITLAQRRDLVGRNVAELVDLPQGTAGRPSKALTMGQAEVVLNAAEDSRLHAYITVSLLTGIRTEEARALTWDRVHLMRMEDVPPHIEVWRSVRVGGDTKTRKSRRTLRLPEHAVTALKAHRARQAADRLAAGALWQETGLVFTTSVGTALDAANVRRGFRSVVVSAGISGLLGNALRELREKAALRPASAATGLGWTRSKLNGIENGRSQIKGSDLGHLLQFYGVGQQAAATLEQMRCRDSWTPRELRHSFVSLLSASGVPVESIARLVGHAGTTVTEAVYRKELRPVLTEGAEAMDSILRRSGT